MSKTTEQVVGPATGEAARQDLLEQYGCGPIRFSGHQDALYERHLLFDDIIAPAAAGAREQFEAAARSGRDVLSQRWVLTESTYDSRNPKRIYYLSMEFLIGRSLTNNVKNPLQVWETAGLGASRLAFSTRWRLCSCQRWAMGCAMNTACSSNPSKTAGNTNSPTTGCVAKTRGRSLIRTRPSRSSSAVR